MKLTKEEALLLHSIVFSFASSAAESGQSQLEDLLQRFKDFILSSAEDGCDDCESYEDEYQSASESHEDHAVALQPDCYLTPESLADLDAIEVKQDGSRSTSLEFELRDSVLDLILDYSIVEDVEFVKLESEDGQDVLSVKTSEQEEWLTFTLNKKLSKSWKKVLPANSLCQIESISDDEEEESDYGEDE